MRLRDEIWAVPKEKRGDVFDTLSDTELKQLTKGYANSHDAIVDYLGRENVTTVTTIIKPPKGTKNGPFPWHLLKNKHL